MHLRLHGATKKTIISAYYHDGKRFDVTSDHISLSPKLAAKAFEYPILKGIPIPLNGSTPTHYIVAVPMP
jgi:hypothetical protein